MTDFNERTNTLLYKNISLSFYSRKGWCWLCVRGELETWTDCYILTQSSDHSSTSFSSWLRCLNRRSLRAQSPLSAAGSQFGILSPTGFNSNWLELSESLLYFGLTPSCFCCSSAYLHWCISWLMAQSRVNMLHYVDNEFLHCVTVTFIITIPYKILKHCGEIWAKHCIIQVCKAFFSNFGCLQLLPFSKS